MLHTVPHELVPSSGNEIGRMVLDASGKVRLSNDAAAAILGYPSGDALLANGRTLEEFAGHAFATLSASAGDWRVVMLPDAEGRQVSVHASLGRTRDGRFEVFLVGGAPPGSIRAPVPAPVGHDLSLLEVSQSGLFIKSMNCELLYVNRAHADMLGYEPEEMAGMPGMEVIHEPDLPRCMDMLFGKPWHAGETREVQVRMRMKHDAGLRHVIIRQSHTTHEGREAFIGSVRDVTDLRRGEQALRDYAQRLRRTSRQVLEAQENERRNLARELHDEVGQQLTMLKLSLAQMARRETGYPPIQEALETLSGLMDRIRSISLDLRPALLDDLGLGPTLRWYVGRIARLASLAFRVEIDAAFPRLPPDVETLFFRVAQEALTNIVRHARAETLTLKLAQRSGRIELEVSDDGQGFDPAQVRCATRGDSAGLRGMQERAVLGGAELRLDSTPGQGTVVQLAMAGKPELIGRSRA